MINHNHSQGPMMHQKISANMITSHAIIQISLRVRHRWIILALQYIVSITRDRDWRLSMLCYAIHQNMHLAPLLYDALGVMETPIPRARAHALLDRTAGIELQDP